MRHIYADRCAGTLYRAQGNGRIRRVLRAIGAGMLFVSTLAVLYVLLVFALAV